MASFAAVSIAEFIVAILQALFCLFYLVSGHAILRAAHLSGYAEPISSSAKVGAVGGLVMTLPAILLCIFRRKGLIFIVWSIAVDTTLGAMAGALGVAMLKNRLHGEMLDPLHAASAGALGAVIISSGVQLMKKLF